MRRVCEEDDCYIDKARPSKRAHRQGYKDENLVVTSENIRFRGKLLLVVKRVWQEIDVNDR